MGDVSRGGSKALAMVQDLLFGTYVSRPANPFTLYCAFAAMPDLSVFDAF